MLHLSPGMTLLIKCSIFLQKHLSIAVFFVFIAGVNPCVLCFRVKFYPSDPMKLHEEITRYAAGKVI